MPKLVTTITFLTAAMLLGSAHAQQTSAAKTTKTPAAKTSPAAKPSSTAKTHAAAPATTPLVLSTEKAKFSYALGMNMAMGLQKQSVEFDPDIFARAMKDATGGKTLLTEDEAKKVLEQTQNEVRQRSQAKMKEEGANNKKDGDAFLAANKTKPGVVTLPSGLQYKVLAQGTGPKPAASDSVVCNYRGTLINGTEFDSSFKRGQPVTFPVTGVIKGWVEALQLMPVGSKWQLFVPADLAYGDRAMSPELGPNETLIFEVELLSIKEKTASSTPPGSAPATDPASGSPDQGDEKK